MPGGRAVEAGRSYVTVFLDYSQLDWDFPERNSAPRDSPLESSPPLHSRTTPAPSRRWSHTSTPSTKKTPEVNNQQKTGAIRIL